MCAQKFPCLKAVYEFVEKIQTMKKMTYHRFLWHQDHDKNQYYDAMFLFRPKGDENFGQAGLDIHGLFKSILYNLHFDKKQRSVPRKFNL